MNEKDIIELYRKQVETLNEKPPETCWEEISNQLDIEEVWDHVSVELDNVLPTVGYSGNNKFYDSLLVFARAALVLTPLVICLLLLLSDNRRPILPPVEKSADYILQDSDDQPATQTVKEPPPFVSAQKAQGAKDIPDVIITQAPENTGPENQFTETAIIENVETVLVPGSSEMLTETVFMLNSASTQAETKITLSYPNLYNSFILSVLPPEQQMAYPDPIRPPPALLTPGTIKNPEKLSSEGIMLTSGPQHVKRFSVGISLSEKNTWMISQETIEGLDRQELNTTTAKFLIDFGLLLQYSLSERWSLETTFFLSSKTGQSYNQYLNGVYSSKIYELKYYSLELSTRYSVRKSPGITKARSYMTSGIYFSYLNSAYKSIDNSLFNISHNYDPVDYGLMVGYEVEIPLLDRFAVTPGLRIKCGIPNIFADQPGVPDDLHSTRNASLEFRLNMILPLPRKK